MRQTYQKRRDFIVGFFEKELPQLSIVPPKGAFYVFADMSVLRDNDRRELSMKVCEDMLDRVNSSPASALAPTTFIRISYAAWMISKKACNA